jgi:hypothetical protein
LYSTEFLQKKFHCQLCAIQLNVKFNTTFSGLLCAMRHSTESQLSVMWHSAELTHIHKYLQIESKFKNILG